jgi:hypothetical protein
MLAKDLRLTDGAAAGDWIKPRLGGEFGAVSLQVPKGYAAYARILHPAWDADGGRVRWADVAKQLGTTAHREMQWHAIRGLADTDELQISIGEEATNPPWAGSDPNIGSLHLDDLDALCAFLAAHTADPTSCFFGLCTIESWEEDFRPEELENGRLLELPMGRNQIVLAGPLSAVDQIVRDWSKPSPSRATPTFATSDGAPPELDPSWLPSREAPNMIWPADRSWLVCSEVDFDSTWVGGSAGLIKEIIASADLEAWQVEPTTSLAADADKINVVPESNA